MPSTLASATVADRSPTMGAVGVASPYSEALVGESRRGGLGRRGTVGWRLLSRNPRDQRRRRRDVKALVDHVNEQAGQLRQQTAPSALARIDQRLLGDIDRNIGAIDTRAAWNIGRTVNIDKLVDALNTRDRTARNAPTDATDTVTRTQLCQLTEPLAEWLTDRGYLTPTRAIDHQPQQDRG